MNCYDCAQLGCMTPAIAVCTHCGAAVCPAHARIIAEAVHHMTGTGLSTLPRTARRITCVGCYAAEHSAERGVAAPHRRSAGLS